MRQEEGWASAFAFNDVQCYHNFGFRRGDRVMGSSARPKIHKRLKNISCKDFNQRPCINYVLNVLNLQQRYNSSLAVTRWLYLGLSIVSFVFPASVLKAFSSCWQLLPVSTSRAKQCVKKSVTCKTSDGPSNEVPTKQQKHAGVLIRLMLTRLLTGTLTVGTLSH